MLVDAENVRRSRWPNLSGEELVQLCRTWAAATGVHAVVVFDRRTPSGATGELELDERCVVAGSGRESADAWLERRAAQLHEQGRPYWLVTSDRALRSAAGGHAERTVGGGAFLRELSA